MKMVVADTTNVNAGRKMLLVFNHKTLITEKKFQQPQFIGCQSHILDRVLRPVMDNNLGVNIHRPISNIQLQ